MSRMPPSPHTVLWCATRSPRASARRRTASVSKTRWPRRCACARAAGRRRLLTRSGAPQTKRAAAGTLHSYVSPDVVPAMQRALPPEAAASLWCLLVGRYFPLSREARELWPSDPEEYLAQGETGEGEGWREVLYAVLVRSHRKVKAAAGTTDPAALVMPPTRAWVHERAHCRCPLSSWRRLGLANILPTASCTRLGTRPDTPHPQLAHAEPQAARSKLRWRRWSAAGQRNARDTTAPARPSARSRCRPDPVSVCTSDALPQPRSPRIAGHAAAPSPRTCFLRARDFSRRTALPSRRPSRRSCPTPCPRVLRPCAPCATQ